MRIFDVRADLVPGYVYYNARRQQYVYVLGRLPNKPGGPWVKARPALLDEIVEYKRKRKVREAERIERGKQPINTVVDLSHVAVYWAEPDDWGFEC